MPLAVSLSWDGVSSFLFSLPSVNHLLISPGQLDSSSVDLLDISIFAEHQRTQPFPRTSSREVLGFMDVTSSPVIFTSHLDI